jgi:transcriptional regulator of nitric oxide reductase
LARWLFPIVVGALMLGPAIALAAKPRPGPSGAYVERYLLEFVVRRLNPEADRSGPVAGTPPAMPLYRGDTLLGYAFDTWDVLQAVGYSRKPFHVLAAIDLEGRVTGTHLVHHLEPITLLGRDDDDVRDYLRQFAGVDMAAGVQVMFDGAARQGIRSNAERHIDGISRATTSSLLFADAILRGARTVARARGVSFGSTAARRLDLETYAPQSWPDMIAEGALAHGAASGDPDGALAELWVGLVDPAGIGINLLGRRAYRSYAAGRALSDTAVFVATSARAPLIPDGDGGALGAAELRIVQGDRSIALTGDMFEPVLYYDGDGQPRDIVQGLYYLAGADRLDATRPWRLEVSRPGASGGGASFTVDYRLPARYVIGADVETELAGATPPTAPDWRAQWRDQRGSVILLGASLALLLAILSLQDAVARRPRLHLMLRLGFLAWTVGWIGWVAGAQLSVIHMLNWVQSVGAGVDWAFFLMEPLIFLMSAFVVVAALLWGRAAFCGWLCPFGALQELLNRLAVRLRVPQIEVPARLAERLTAVKYLVFFGLLGLTFYSIELAYAVSGVEPFKAAITFRFDAPWPAVAYAVALLAVGLTIERFYCRFICPLGAGLAILGRLRMFDWLKRRVDCGAPCRKCEQVCPVRAIRVDGTIDMNECFYCLDCQVVYHDAHQCPPLIKRRRRREAAKTPAL